MLTHFSKRPNCEVCRRTKLSRAPCGRRSSNHIPRAEKCGDFITTDHKVLNEEVESRNNHKSVEIVQGLATQWIRRYYSITKTSQETASSLHESKAGPKVIYTDN